MADAQSKAQAAATATATQRAQAEASGTPPKPLSHSPSPPPAIPRSYPAAATGRRTWVCSFDDEFSATGVDPRSWTPITTAASGYQAGDSCFLDKPSNISVSAGALHLTTRKEVAPFSCTGRLQYPTRSQSAANIASMSKFSQAYGRFVIRVRFPAATIAGLQASLWLWPQNYLYGLTWPLSGEIDMAEEYSQYPDRVIPYVHYLFDPALINIKTNTNTTTNTNCLVKNVNAYHEYALE